MNLSGNERILVVKPSSLGDIVHTLPAVSAIHRAFPETSIDWLVNTEWAPLLEGISCIEKVISFPRRDFRGLSGLFEARRWCRENLAAGNYDLALDFQGLLRSALLCRLSGATRVLGFANARELAHCLYGQSIRVPEWWATHAVDRNREIAHALGIDTSPVEFPLPEGEPVEIPDQFATGAILLHPFSRGLGKSLSMEEVRELCEQSAPHPVWLVGKTEIEETVDWPGNVFDLLNQTSLSQLIFLLRKAAWSISVDSGPMHLASGISERVISIHTWSDPRMVGPWRKDSWVWRDSKIMQVGDLHGDMFPELRKLRDVFEAQKRILSPGDISNLAGFVRQQLAS